VVVEAEEVVEKAMQAPSLGVSGADAVADAQERQELRTASGAPQDEAKAVRHAGEHTFVNRSGIWVDAQFDAGTMQVIKVPFGSERYFEMAADPKLAAYLALGPQVVFVDGGEAYQITPAEEGEPLPTVEPTVEPAEEPQPGDQKQPSGESPSFWEAVLAWLQRLLEGMAQASQSQ
jgi:hypothetical protein